LSVVSARIVRRIIEASRGPSPPSGLLEQAGLSPDPGGDEERVVPSGIYYDVLERCGADDPTLPLRYGMIIRPEDFGAFGLSLKTAHGIRDVLERLARYILVISDSLEYALVAEGSGSRFVLGGRPADGRRGIELANECAMAAIVSLLRQVAERPVTLVAVSLRHAATDRASYSAWFGCPVRFEAPVDALHLDEANLSVPTRLADEGLSAYFLAQIEAIHAQRAEGAIVQQVRSAIADKLCSGLPKRGEVARHLGMSPRTLHRRLADRGCSYQAVANQVRREMAESLLSRRGLSLAEVAYMTGFSDQSAFQRAFKSWTGTTPNGFRQGASAG